MRNIELKLSDLLKNTSSDSDGKYKFDNTIVMAFKKSDVVIIDFEKVKSFPPSLAYEYFGKLVDEFGPNLGSRISCKNDPFGFSKRIYDAIERRISIMT